MIDQLAPTCATLKKENECTWTADLFTVWSDSFITHVSCTPGLGCSDVAAVVDPQKSFWFVQC